MKLFVYNFIAVAIKQHAVLIYINTTEKYHNNVPKNVNVKRGLFVGDVTMLARIHQASNGRLWYFAHMIALNFSKRW